MTKPRNSSGFPMGESAKQSRAIEYSDSFRAKDDSLERLLYEQIKKHDN